MRGGSKGKKDLRGDKMVRKLESKVKEVVE